MSGTYSARRAVGQPAVAFTRRRACDSGSALANPPELPGICSGCPLVTQSASRPTVPRTAALEFCLRLRRSAGPSASRVFPTPAQPVRTHHRVEGRLLWPAGLWSRREGGGAVGPDGACPPGPMGPWCEEWPGGATAVGGVGGQGRRAVASRTMTDCGGGCVAG